MHRLDHRKNEEGFYFQVKYMRVLHEGKGNWNGMQTWEGALKAYKGDPQNILATDPGIAPEDNATILFTSGMLGAEPVLFLLIAGFLVPMHQ